MDALAAKYPDVASLWDLNTKIATQQFGANDLFQERPATEDMALQREGEKQVPQLSSGSFDIGLAAALKGNVGEWRSPSFRSLLESYRGLVTPAQALQTYVPVLQNAEAYKFTRFVAPIYPALARQARVQGSIELQLAVDSDSGNVVTVTVVSGHPLFRQSALDASKQWSFAPGFAVAKTVNLTLNYRFQCP